MNTAAAVALLAAGTKAQSNSSSSSGSCSSTLTASYAAPSVASGYSARLVATGLTSPRGIKFDTAGNLLVIEEEVGVTALRFEDDDDGCLNLASKDTVVADTSLNHGIEISEDGNTLYASNSDKLYSWDYSSDERRVTSNATTLVENMEGTDHTSRTLLLTKSAPGMIVINRGSFENIDIEARDIGSGHSQVKAFNISGVSSPLDFLDETAACNLCRTNLLLSICGYRRVIIWRVEGVPQQLDICCLQCPKSLIDVHVRNRDFVTNGIDSPVSSLHHAVLLKSPPCCPAQSRAAPPCRPPPRS